MPISEIGKLVRTFPKDARARIENALLVADLDFELAATSLAASVHTLHAWVKRLNLGPWIDSKREQQKRAIRTGDTRMALRPKPWKKKPDPVD